MMDVKSLDERLCSDLHRHIAAVAETGNIGDVPGAASSDGMKALLSMANDLSNGVTTEDAELLKIIDAQSDDNLRTLADKYPDTPLLTDKYGQGLFRSGDIVCIKAQVGQGKTYACSILASALCGGCKDFCLTPNGAVNVFYIDTENLPMRTTLFMDRVNRMTNNSSRFHCTSLANMVTDKRKLLELIKVIIERSRRQDPNTPIVVIIDGIARLVSDYNSISECKRVIDPLSVMAGDNVCFICVIHENQSFQARAGGKMTGSLGSYLMQLSREVFGVKKNKDIFTLYCNGSNGTKYTDGERLHSISWQLIDDVPTPRVSSEDQKETDNKSEILEYLTQYSAEAMGESLSLSGRKFSARLRNTLADHRITISEETIRKKWLDVGCANEILFKDRSGRISVGNTDMGIPQQPF